MCCEKCAEAAALRQAFPEEIGGEEAAEEVDEPRADDAAIVAPAATEATNAPGTFRADATAEAPCRRRRRSVEHWTAEADDGDRIAADESAIIAGESAADARELF